MNNSFIVIGLDSWESACSTDVGRLTKALSRGSRVLYAEPPSGSEPTPSKGNKPRGRPMQSVRPMIRQLSERLILFSPPVVLWRADYFPRGVVRDTIVRINSLRYSESIAWAVRTVGLGEFAVITDNSAALSPALLAALGGSAALYYLSCSPMSVPLLRAADAVVATSSRLTDAARNYNINSFDIGEGINPVNGRRKTTNWNKSAQRIEAILRMLKTEERVFGNEREKEKMFN